VSQLGWVVTLSSGLVRPLGRRGYEGLIARISAWEADPPPDQPWSYYQHWLGALEDVLAGVGTVATEEITARAAELAHRPAGHDHREPHQH